MALSEEREQELLDAIAEFTSENGYPPTLRELCDRLGLRGRSYVERLLTGLKETGRVEWDPYRSRTLRVVDGDTGPPVRG